MKKKILALSLLALTSGMVLASCGGGNSTSSNASISEGVSEPDSKGGDDVSASAEVEEIAPTRVKITQPGTVLVGTVLKVKDICVFTPENANKWDLSSDNEEVALPDGDTIKILAPGKAKVKVTTPKSDGSPKVLGTIILTALSEEGLAIQEFADSVTNAYFIDASWAWYENKEWDDVTDDDVIAEVDPIALACTPNYVLDWCYGRYSSIRIEDDGNDYSFALLDSKGDPLPGETDETVAGALARAVSVELSDRADPNYIDLYFSIDELLDITLWEEEASDDGDPIFVTDDPTVAISLLGNMFGMNTSVYTGVGASIWLNEEGDQLEGMIQFNDSRDADFVTFAISVGDDAKIDLLEDAVKNASAPEATDVEPIVNALANYTDNFFVDWEIGVFDNQTLEPIDEFYDSNSVGTTIIDGDTAVYASVNRDKTTGDPDMESLEFGGIYTDIENGGVYFLDVNNDSILVKEDSAISGSDFINDPIEAREEFGFVPLSLLDKDKLEGASLSLYETEYGSFYNYNASFDGLVLGYLLSSLCPLGYSDLFDNPENAGYCEGYIFLGEDLVEIAILERVALDDTGTSSGYLGIIATLYGSGAAKIDLGDNVMDAFFPEQE